MDIKIKKIVNQDFFKNNLLNIIIFKVCGYEKTKYDSEISKINYFKEIYNINEVFIFRTNSLKIYIIYELYEDNIFYIESNEEIVNIFQIIPNHYILFGIKNETIIHPSSNSINVKKENFPIKLRANIQIINPILDKIDFKRKDLPYYTFVLSNNILDRWIINIENIPTYINNYKNLIYTLDEFINYIQIYFKTIKELMIKDID